MPFSGYSRRFNTTVTLLLGFGVLLSERLPAQLTTGILAGTVRTADGRPAPGVLVLVTGAAGFRLTVHSDSKGEFNTTLPYGRYSLSGVAVFVPPLQTTRVELEVRASGVTAQDTAGIWTDDHGGRLYPESSSLAGLLLSREPSSVAEPLDFTGLSDNRIAIESQRAFSWTDTQYKLQGMDATDSYQPGIPVILPDNEALDAVVVRSAFTQTTSSSMGTEAGLFLSGAGSPWHGSFSTANTGDWLSSNNLPPPADRGLVQQAQQFRWFTSDRLEIGGPITKWADFFASSRGQWASQTEPLAAAGVDQRSRLLFANARGRIRAGAADQFDALYSGSRVDLSSGGIPDALEALTGNRLAPSFVLPGGFLGQPEVDHLDFVQAGWTHSSPERSILGSLELRYQYSTAHLDTNLSSSGPSRIELLGGTVSGSPPLANLAVRTRQQVEAAWQPAMLHLRRTSHELVAGGGWKSSAPRNRFNAPSDMNLTTANGVPAFVTEFNTPLDSRELVRSFSLYLADRIRAGPSLSIDLGALADFSCGSLPAQSSAAGLFTPARTLAALPDLISWNSVSPRAGFAYQVPRLHGLVLRGTWFRLYAPLTGRYLDFGNPNSLGGSVYQWTTTNPYAPFQSQDRGALLLRFGGPYSSISPSLRRPYSDEFDVGAAAPLTKHGSASIQLFRRDERDRIAAIDTGVGAQDFTPVVISDPGPDGIPGTFDDQRLTVYAQNPATLGQDRYLLTNPAGLRTLNAGLQAEIGTTWRSLLLHASFVAEKSYGSTNPGDAVYENDPGVIGALLLDPNTAIHAAGRSFVDRAYVGKIQAVYRMPASWGGIEVSSVADYLDGLVFARQLLVTGLPQGPFLVATTVRGSPEGGNRSQYVVNWNLRLSRSFQLPFGRLRGLVDILNVTNAAQRLQENDLSGPTFNLRLPVSIEPPRFVRLGLRYDF